MTSKAFYEGYNAALSGDSDNPYSKSSKEYKDWADGFDYGLLEWAAYLEGECG